MLQLPNTKSAPVPPSPRSTKSRPQKSALSVIRSDIQPIGDDPDLLGELRRMSKHNDVGGMVALYDAYSAAAEGLLLIQNQPRVSDAVDEFIEMESNHLWSKAYLVAQFLKDLRPDHRNVERYMTVLFNCAFQMGCNVPEVVAIVQEIAGFSKT